MSENKLKSKTTQEFEIAISRAISEMMGEEFGINILSIIYSDSYVSEEATIQIKIHKPIQKNT